jgi:predicted esterase
MKPHSPERPRSSLGRGLRALLSLVAAAATVWCQPVITVEPQDQLDLAGTTVQFTVEATGIPPLIYQWATFTDAVTSTVLPEATNTVLVLTNLQATSLLYGAIVSNSEGSVTSRLASITIAVPPGLTAATAPRSQAITLNGTATVSVTPKGTKPLFVQWRLEGQNLTDKTNNSLSLKTLQPAQEGLYTAVISNAFGCITSPPARITVLPAYTNLAARTLTTPTGKLPYRLSTPANYTAAQRYPLVMFLHGAGEVGTDNAKQLSVWPNAMVYISYQRQQTSPLFFVAPQCPSDGWWPNAKQLGQLLNLFDALAAEFSIDTNRIYITGLSMGGMGSWGLLEQRPWYFAAAMPICGNGNNAAARTFKDVAIWNFHAADDGSVAIAGSRTMIAAIRQAGGHPLYTEYASGGHGIWPEAYATPGLVDWTLTQRRGEPIKNSPVVTLQDLPANGQRSTRATQLDLAGHAQTWGEAVTQIKWSNSATNRTGAGVATNDWQLNGIPLVAGKTNVIVVAAGTSSFAPAWGGATTFSVTLPVLVDLPIGLATRHDSEELTLDWAGGAGPYRLQRAVDPVRGPWLEVLTDAQPPVSVPLDGEAGFYRVIEP